MRHTAEKRFLSMFLAMVMLLTMLPISALAKSSFNTTVLDGKFTVVTTDGTSGQKGATVNADGSLKMAVTAVTGCTGSFESVATHTVTITNVTAEELMIKFDYGSLTNLGTLKIDGTAKTQAGSYSKTVGASGTIVIELTSASNSSETSVVFSGFELKDTSTKAVTVNKTDNGTVKVNGTTLSDASVTINADYATGVTVAATPASGYVFVAWLDSAYNVVSTTASTVIQPLEDMIVGAYFVPNDTQAYWLAGGKLHTDLNTACAAAQSADKTVVLIKNGTLPSGTHTIPADVSVLIPFDDAHTSYGTGDPELAPNNSSQKFVAPTAYRTLTMASGSTLVVNGTLEMAAKHHVSAGHDTGSNGGAIWGKYGHISMAANSKIAVNGTMCAWGVVSGEGEVVANSGSYIYEKMQIADYRGGSATSSLATTYSSRKVFPFSQYYVQNVEVKETINAGATLMVNVGVYLSASEQSTVAFVGPSGAMFTLGAGAYVTKQYDAANDRLKLDAYGNTSLSSISLSFEGQSVNSASFRLGLNNNIDIRIHSGVTTISQDVVLQAGATVTVDREATLYNTAELFVMDSEDWGTFARGKTIIPVMWSYANGTTVKRTGVTDAIVDINGTVINGGQLYSTGSDSFISSEKTGIIVYNTPANSSATMYQLDHNSFTLGMTSDWVTLTCTPAILVNGDKTTVTASGAQYDAFIYDSFQDKWIQKNLYNGGSGYTVAATYDANGGTGTVPAANTVDYLTQIGAFAQTGTLAPLSFALPQTNITREGFEFIGWSSDPNATEAQFVPGDYVALSADTTVYAVWKGTPFALTVDGVTQEVLCGTDLSGYLTEPTKDGYVFTGWSAAKADGTAVDLPATMPAYDLVITANFRQLQKYTLSFLNENGEVISSIQVLEGNAISAPAYSKEGYDFLGWINTATGAVETVASVMPQSNLEYQASMKIKTYTIKFMNGTTEVGEVTADHGQQATLIGALTAANAVFKGWGETADVAKYEAGATITVTGDMTLYAVWHNHTPEVIPAVEATCTSTGLTEGSKCADCGEILVTQEEVAMKPHTEVIDAAVESTCTSTGLTEGKHCSVCDKVLVAQEEVAMKPHTEVIDAAVEATCTSTGLTEGKHCSVCDKVLVAQIETPVIAHKYNAVITTVPGCESAGVKTFTCEGCGDTYTETLAATGHNYVAGTPVPPTCTEQGYTVYTCPCGDSYKADFVDATDHTEVIDAAVEATCTSTGLTEGKHCDVCGEVLVAQEEVAMKPHTEVIDAAVEATCTSTGLTEGKHCSVCGEVLVAQNEVPANGHSFVNGGCENCDAEIQVSLPGSFNGWDTSVWIMTRNEDGTYTYIAHLDAANYEFKVMDDGKWLGNNGTINDHTYGYEWTFSEYEGSNCTLVSTGGTYTFTYNINTKGLKVDFTPDHVHAYDVTFTWSDYYAACSASAVCKDENCGDSWTADCTITSAVENSKVTFTASCGEYSDTVTVDEDATNTVYVDISNTGWNQVYAYCWNDSGFMAEWPGTKMENISGTVYAIIVPDGFDNLIFNNGNGGIGNQTPDMKVPTNGENIAVLDSEIFGKWGYIEPATYTVTFLSDDVSVDTQSVPYGGMPTAPADPTKANDGCTAYTFNGWDKELTVVTGEAVYTATYTQSISHTGELECVFVDYLTHKVVWSCCGEVEAESVEHDEQASDYCQCGGVVIFILTDDAYINGTTLDNNRIFVESGSTFSAEVTPAEGYERVVVQITDYSTLEHSHTLNATQLVLGPEYTTVPNPDLEVLISGYWDLVFDMNGGDVAEEYKGMFNEEEYDPENGILKMYMPSGAYTNIPTLKDVFVREGYTLAAVQDGDVIYTGDEKIAAVDGDRYLTLIWECCHAEWINATCTTPKTCATCGETEGEALGHTEETVAGYAATCTETGLTDGVKCSLCGEILIAQEEIAALGHGHTKGISYEEGDNTHDVFCDDCYTTIEWNVECTYSKDTHECVCGNVETFTIEWYDSGTFKSETYKYGETVTGPEPICEVTDQGKNSFLYWYDLSDGSEVPLPMTMPAKNLQLQAAYSYTGWAGVIGSDYYTFWIDNMEVQGWFNVNENNEPVGEGEGKRYYAGEDYNVVNTITLIDGVYYAFDCDTAAFLGNYTGIYEARNGDLYYVENGIAVQNKGLVKTTDENGHIHYYYFGCAANNCSADPCNGEYKAQKSNRHYAQITNGLLVPGGYTFGKDCVIEHIDDTSVNGIYEIDGVKYCLMDGVKVAMGLFEEDGKLYYARSSGELVIDQNYWVSKTNGLTINGNPVKNGTYYFDENGVLTLKNGFYFENDAWYYYVDDVKNYAGLIWCDGPEGGDPGYYYVNSSCQLVTDCAYWISKNNGYMKNTTYYFDENGTMYTPAPKEGFYFENGAWYYYVEGKLNYAGLIWCDGPEGNDPGYYYINSQCQLVTGCDYWISKNNGHMGNQTYTFAENGKMVQTTDGSNELLNGFVEEDGEIYYYVDGLKTYAGLIEVDGDYYYVNSKGKVVRDCTYWISKNNGYVSNGNYTFDAEGKMVQA